MTIEEEGPPPHPRLQGVLEHATILAVAIAGMAHAPPGIAVPLAAVVLLWVSDRRSTAGLSTGSGTLREATSRCSRSARRSLLNLVATAAAYVFGVVAWWVWMG